MWVFLSSLAIEFRLLYGYGSRLLSVLYYASSLAYGPLSYDFAMVWATSGSLVSIRLYGYDCEQEASSIRVFCVYTLYDSYGPNVPIAMSIRVPVVLAFTSLRDRGPLAY